MSQIFYSQVDPNLQQELLLRASAGKTDRSETALRYMTEKIANAEVTAYEGNRRDATKIVHTLGGKTVLTGEYLPGGDYGFLSERPYTLAETRWTTGVLDDSVTVAAQTKTEKLNNTSYRIPPFINGVELAINDNSRGLTNKATINIIIPNPERDLDFMESVYARPGRYCSLLIAHPDSALMTRDVANVNGLLDQKSLPNFEFLKENSSITKQEYDELRKMNEIRFEGLITSFEYQYTQDGSVTMTVYILGTSMVYTDLSMIMQTGTAAEVSASQDPEIVDQAKSFYQAIYDEVSTLYKLKTDETGVKWAFGLSQGFDRNNPKAYFAGHTSITGNSNMFINLNYLMSFINRKILTKIKLNVDKPTILTSANNNIRCNYYPNLCSSDPDNILLPGHIVNPTANVGTDCYGWFNKKNTKFNLEKDKKPARKWFPNLDFTKDVLSELSVTPTFYPTAREKAVSQRNDDSGRPGHIMINLKVVETIINELAGTKDQFTVKAFLERISAKINSATGGAIDLKLTADPSYPLLMYFRDANWIFDPSNPKPQPFLIPMFANDPRGTIVRDFKLSAKLPSNAQSLMYAINSSDKVTEDQVAPYMNFMYNNAATKRSGTGANTTDTVVYGDKEMTRKLAEQYKETHEKYLKQLHDAREAFGADPTNTQKQISLAAALKKYIQYPRPTIEQSNQLAAPVFPIDAEFTIDGINGFRYGDIVDFPGIPEKYRRCTTFTIKGISHSVSEAGEWTTKVSCMMRPRFD
jgi:hypothetical protein